MLMNRSAQAEKIRAVMRWLRWFFSVPDVTGLDRHSAQVVAARFLAKEPPRPKRIAKIVGAVFGVHWRILERMK